MDVLELHKYGRMPAPAPPATLPAIEFPRPHETERRRIHSISYIRSPKVSGWRAWLEDRS